MKQYQKKIQISFPAPARAPIYFELNKTELTLRMWVQRVFDNTGAYLGWVTDETMRKYLYGQIYYKAKRAYRIETSGQTKRIIHKLSSGIALTFIETRIEDKHLVDVDNRAELWKMLKKTELNPWAFNKPNTLTDPYELIADEKRRWATAREELLERQQAELAQLASLQRIEYNKIIDDNIEQCEGLVDIALLKQAKKQPTA